MASGGYDFSEVSALIAGHSVSEMVFIVLAALTAGLARGFSGFGGALIFMPLASAIIEPKLAAAVLFLIDAFLSLPMIPGSYRQADRREVAVMVAGAAFGVPVGTAILSYAEPLTVRWAITGLVTVLLALLMSGWRYRGQPTRPLTVGTGFISGVFGGAAQVGGPPVVAYWLGGPKTALLVRANIVFYFALSTALTGVNYGLAGLFTWSAAAVALLAGPTFALGLFVGSRLFGRVDEAAFRRICFLLIAAAAIIGMPVLDGVLR
ncbi:sulfite exporter TauE/SafE family protein [Rhizobium sp. RU36D]|uniref:sulfite exporter TauE/SafE family protein n=1 Tax=Rhizobium sp. RU36D TaxID=1907415 RepID=UPI0009D87A8C|nr:sulfite exporter TauE/SafE family protein [Rhizobium sp. RU36D]SMC91450.1 hypothetical protein SAMN05880593_11057 [Rhizobium sp. RU36D]